ncbi:MAG TPA: hypothetical protein VFF06_32910 [Polyangia bacterium]|nr:hypothetical protein [Polyangia bacterium]
MSFRTALLLSLAFAPACASGPPEGVRTEIVRGGSCSLDVVDWPAAERDFNRARSAELAAKLEAAARADQQAFAADPATRALGAELTAINRGVPRDSYQFVAHDVASLALRLRQLDCALLGGALRSEPDTAQRRYQSIIQELTEQRKKLG